MTPKLLTDIDARISDSTLIRNSRRSTFAKYISVTGICTSVSLRRACLIQLTTFINRVNKFHENKPPATFFFFS